MKAKVLIQLISFVVSMLNPDLMRKFADMVLDFVEDNVLGTKSTIDDAIVLPICGMIRTTFSIPDKG